MDLLNIKGSQKAAQVMKELVDYGLVANKRIGLTRCNEIYLYLPDGDEPTDSSGGHRSNAHSDDQPSLV